MAAEEGSFRLWKLKDRNYRTKETNKHMTIMVIDGQGGKMGKGLVEQLKKLCPEDEILGDWNEQHCHSSNAEGRGRMPAPPGENPAVVTSRTADIIVGPMGIVIADSLHG